MLKERLEILRMVEAGQIDADQATALLGALDADEEPVSGLPASPVSDSAHGREKRWSSFWIYPLMAGGVLLVLGALVMAGAYVAGLARAWLLCGWLPMLLGLMVVLLALWSRRAKWLHLRIREEGKRRIALSFPLPLSLAAWALRVAQPFVPQLAETGVDDLIIALRDSDIDDEVLVIDVQDDESGEHVQLTIG